MPKTLDHASLNFGIVYNTQLPLTSGNFSAENRQNEHWGLTAEKSPAYVTRAPRVPYRWRKLKITYSAIVLAMYPYLAEPDSDGDDDIEEGEEDDYIRWDPVQRVHVKREIPLTTAIGQSIGIEHNASMDVGMSEPLVEDQIGVEILLEAAKALLDDRLGDQDVTGGAHTSGISAEQPEAEGEMAYEADSFPSSSPALRLPTTHALTHRGALAPCSSPFLKCSYDLPGVYDYPPNPGAGYALPILKKRDYWERKDDSLLAEISQDFQSHKNTVIYPKNPNSGGLDIGYDFLGLPKIPRASETHAVVRTKVLTNREAKYQPSVGGNSLETTSSVGNLAVGHKGRMSPHEVMGEYFTGPHPYPTERARTPSRPSHTSQFNECDPVHRFHNFKHRTDFRRSAITYRRTYDKQRSQVRYKQKPSHEQESVCSHDNDDHSSIPCEHIGNSHSEAKHNPNFGTYGPDRYEYDSRETHQDWELTATTAEDMMVLDYMPIQPKGLWGLLKGSPGYSRHTNLTSDHSTTLTIYDVMRCRHLQSRLGNPEEFRDCGYICPDPKHITNDANTYIPQYIQNQVGDIYPSENYGPEVLKIGSSKGGSAREQKNPPSMMDLPISVQEYACLGVSRKARCRSKSPGEQESFVPLMKDSPASKHGMARGLPYKGTATGCQYMVGGTKGFTNYMVKKQVPSAEPVSPGVVGADNAVIKWNLEQAISGLPLEDLGQHGGASDNTSSTTGINRGKGQHWEKHTEFLDRKLERFGQPFEGFDNNHRESPIYSKTTHQKRRHHEGSDSIKSLPHKRRHHISISKEAELQGYSRRRHRHRHESRSPSRPHKSPRQKRRRRSDFESDRLHIRTKDRIPDRGRRRNRDHEYDHHYSTTEGPGRNSVGRKSSNHTPSPSPVDLVKISRQQGKDTECTHPHFQGEYAHRKASGKSSKSYYKKQDYSPHRRRHRSSHASESSWDSSARHRSPSVQIKTTRQQEIVPVKVHQIPLNRSRYPIKKEHEQCLTQSPQGPHGNSRSLHSNANHGYRGGNNMDRSGYRDHIGRNNGDRGLTWANNKAGASLVSNEDGIQGYGGTGVGPRSQLVRHSQNSYSYPKPIHRNKRKGVDVNVEEQDSWRKYRR